MFFRTEPILGYYAECCLIDLGDTAEARLKQALAAKRFGCVIVGAGLRGPAAMVPLFEKVINLVQALAPKAKIASTRTRRIRPTRCGVGSIHDIPGDSLGPADSRLPRTRQSA
jgi:hypothetical protein